MIEHIFHTLFLDSGELPEQYPLSVRHNLDSWGQYHPNSKQIIFSLNEARAYLHEHFDAETCEAFDALKPYAFKSDLFRYCFLLRHGGLYVDIAFRALKAVPVINDLVLFTTPLQPTPWCLQQSLIYAKPGAKELEDTIERIKINVRNHEYGVNNLDVTGPLVFGAVVNEHRNYHRYAVGTFNALTPDLSNPNAGLILNGELFAIQLKDKPGDIGHLGLEGTNNYIEMWWNRRVYAEQTRVWDHLKGLRCEQARWTQEGIEFNSEMIGLQSFGPLISLEAGHYSVRIRLGETPLSGKFSIALTSNNRQNLLHQLECDAEKLKDTKQIELTLELAQPSANIEALIISKEIGLTGQLLALEIEQLNGQ